MAWVKYGQLVLRLFSLKKQQKKLKLLLGLTFPYFAWIVQVLEGSNHNQSGKAEVPKQYVPDRNTESMCKGIKAKIWVQYMVKK